MAVNGARVSSLNRTARSAIDTAKNRRMFIISQRIFWVQSNPYDFIWPVWPFTWFYRFLWPTVGSQNEFEPKPKVSSSSFVNRRHSPNLQIWWLKFLNLIPHGFLTDIGISFSWISRFGTKCRFFGILCNFSVYFGKALWWTTVILVKIL